MLTLDNVSFSYPGTNHKLLKNINLSINSKEVIGLAGLNGAGKTTLIKIIRGVLKPDQGNIYFHEKEIIRNYESKVKDEIDYITQNTTNSLFPTMTVFENFVVSKSKLGDFRYGYSKFLRKSCEKLLKRAGNVLNETIDKQVRFLSGGQQQTLSVLFASSNAKSLLLMDEPTASLDLVNSDHVLGLAISTMREKKGAVIFTSHRLENLIQYTNKIFVISSGEISTIINNVNKDISSHDLREAIFNGDKL